MTLVTPNDVSLRQHYVDFTQPSNEAQNSFTTLQPSNSVFMENDIVKLHLLGINATTRW